MLVSELSEKVKKNQGVVKNDFSRTAPLQYHKFYSSVFLSYLIKADCSPCPARDLAFLRECNPLVAEQIFKSLLNLWTTDPSGTCKVWTCIPHLTYNTMPAIIKVGSDLSTVGSFILKKKKRKKKDPSSVLFALTNTPYETLQGVKQTRLSLSFLWVLKTSQRNLTK